MKIIIAGYWGWHHYEESFSMALERLGHKVLPFKTSIYFNGKLGRLQEIIPFNGPAVKKMNADLINLIEEEKPDLFFAWRCTHLKSSTIRKINNKNIISVSYNNDDPFGILHNIKLPWHHKFLWRMYLDNLQYLNLNFFYRKNNILDSKLYKANNPSLMLPAFIPWKDFPIELKPEELVKYKCDVVFVGHYEKDNRVNYLKKIVKAGYKVKLYGGPYWTRQILGELFDYFAPIRSVYNAEYTKALCGAEICLVFLSKINRDTYTRRCFEIPASGKLMLAERTDDLMNMFKEDIEACFFSNEKELIEKINWLMSDKSIRLRIAEAGRLRVLNDKHDIINRASEFIDNVNSIFHARKA
jgi:spore maturation protein CgeB